MHNEKIAQKENEEKPMLFEEGSMYTLAIFSPDRSHRYLLNKQWDCNKPKAMIIMTNPSTADLLTIDYTTLYILNNLAKLNYGSVSILNMDSKITTKLNPKGGISTTAENLEQILKSAESADIIILAFGKIAENNKKVRAVQDRLIEKLAPFEEKLHLIADNSGMAGFHPLASQIRFTWHLVKFNIPEKSGHKTVYKEDTAKKNKK